MRWLLGLAAALLGGYWLLYSFLRQRAASNSVLQARIATPDGLHYAVEFTELVSGVYAVEYVWLCLLLVAKFLYNMDRDQKQAAAKSLLIDMMRRLGATDLRRAANLPAEMREAIEIVPEVPRASRTITLRVRYVNVLRRTSWTTVPFRLFEQQLPHSFLAVVQASLPKLTDDLRDRLQGALVRMLELYNEREWDSLSLKALAEVPNLAFSDARVIVRDPTSGAIELIR